MTLKARSASLLALSACVAFTVAACGSDTSGEDALNVSGTSDSSAAATTSGSTDKMSLAEGLNPDESSSTASTAPSATSGEATTGFSTGDSRADAAPNTALVLNKIRIGEHQGNDRVVFELAGQGTPGYSISYVPSPAQQGSGQAIDVPGSNFLQVLITGQTLPPAPDGSDEAARGTISAQEATQVQGVYFAGQFEGAAQSVIGVEGKRPYSAFLLENPTRLVVDIQR